MLEQRQKEMLTVAGLAIGIFLLFFLFGTWDFHNELPQETIDQEFVAYLDEKMYEGTVQVQLPHTYIEKEVGSEVVPDEKAAEGAMVTVEILSGQSVRLGIFADYIYFENRYEKRNCITGKLLETSSEFYYKQSSFFYIRPIYADTNLQQRVPAEAIKPVDYL